MRDGFGIFGTVTRIRKLSLLLVMMLRIPNSHMSIQSASEAINRDPPSILHFSRSVSVNQPAVQPSSKVFFSVLFSSVLTPVLLYISACYLEQLGNSDFVMTWG